jgi:16S rRNA processing protein RimM
MNPPDDLIELGRILGAYGLRGWVTIAPESGDPLVLKKTKKWWISRLPEVPPHVGKPKAVNPEDLIFEDFEVIESKMHSGKLVAHLQGVESRDLAEKFKGRRIYVPRSRFPQAGKDEYYWVDLVGCRVVNLQGVTLGDVSAVTDHGAHAILAVTPAEAVLAEVAKSASEEPIGDVSDDGSGFKSGAKQSNRKEKVQAVAEILIPFVEAYVPEVRMAERTIIVDWQADY